MSRYPRIPVSAFTILVSNRRVSPRTSYARSTTRFGFPRLLLELGKHDHCDQQRCQRHGDNQMPLVARERSRAFAIFPYSMLAAHALHR